jgi:hypothetical protein
MRFAPHTGFIDKSLSEETMTSELNRMLAEQHIDHLIAGAEGRRLARATDPDRQSPRLAARLAAALRPHGHATRRLTPPEPAPVRREC